MDGGEINMNGSDKEEKKGGNCNVNEIILVVVKGEWHLQLCALEKMLAHVGASRVGAHWTPSLQLPAIRKEKERKRERKKF